MVSKAAFGGRVEPWCGRWNGIREILNLSTNSITHENINVQLPSVKEPFWTDFLSVCVPELIIKKNDRLFIGSMLPRSHYFYTLTYLIKGV